ncbi:S1 family peptidase [Deinococcus hohokamensis]|uniref:Serine protease n=1 Tax=Deinococcus hohokamensis TaxID=309883 RepID=A0ABV9ICD8_9DEIO
MLLTTGTALVMDGMPATVVYANSKNSIVHIQVSGLNSNGQNVTISGSGFLVSTDGFAVTSLHVAKPPNLVAGFLGTASIGSRKGKKYFFTLKDSDEINDVALIKLDTQNTLRPLFVERDYPGLPGETTYVLGFPGDRDINFTDGRLSGEQPSGWTISNEINPGNSGGPVLNEEGNVIGIVKGYGLRNDGSQQEGVSIIVSSDHIVGLVESNKVRLMAHPPSSDRPQNFPAAVSRSFPINIVKDDHPVTFASHDRDYVLEFFPEPGYKFISYKLSAHSETKSKVVKANMTESRLSLIINIRSGPQVNRWRGWFKGNLSTEQARK